MLDVIVVGGGITGCTIAKSFINQNRKVMLIDDDSNLSGSKASGGHFMKSWVSSLSISDYDKAVETLDDLWGVKDREYLTYPKKKKITVSRVKYNSVRNKSELTRGRVIRILKNEQKYPVITYRTLDGGLAIDIKCRLLIVCAGVWCTELLNLTEKIQSKKGVSFQYKLKLDMPFILPWAPYKQIVAHQETKSTVWVGDGSSILEKNWSRKRTSECWDRCSDSLNLKNKDPYKTFHGLRPYCSSGNDPCICREVTPNVWVVTGSGKTGTISSGWASNKLLEVTS